MSLKIAVFGDIQNHENGKEKEKNVGHHFNIDWNSNAGLSLKQIII